MINTPISLYVYEHYRKTSAQKQKSAVPVRSAYEQQLKLLEKERLEAEERRKKEDEALKAQIQELEGKKQAEEEKERLVSYSDTLSHLENDRNIIAHILDQDACYRASNLGVFQRF